MSRITWSDIFNATPTELKKTYKLNDRQLEMGVRRHLDGANAKERRETYESLYAKKR
jgi:hypothetical protein